MMLPGVHVVSAHRPTGAVASAGGGILGIRIRIGEFLLWVGYLLRSPCWRTRGCGVVGSGLFVRILG